MNRLPNPVSFVVFRGIATLCLLCQSNALGQDNIDAVYSEASKVIASIKNFEVSYDVHEKQHYEHPELSGLTIYSSLRGIRFVYLGDSRRYLEETSSRIGTVPFNKATMLFNGEVSLIRRAAQLQIVNGKHPFCDDVDYVQEYLGIMITDSAMASNSSSGAFPECLAKGNIYNDYKVLKRDVIDGVKCLVLESNSYNQRIWLDVDKHYAVKSREIYQDNTKTILKAKYTILGYIQASPMHWIPSNCVRDDYPSASGPPQFINKPYASKYISVKSFKINKLSDHDIKIEVPPGTYVMDRGNNYRVEGTDKATLDQFAKYVTLNYGATVNNSYTSWFIIVNIILFSIICIFLVTYKFIRGYKARSRVVSGWFSI